MTPIEIAYFKHFMYDKGLQKSFQYYYRKNPVKVNQKSNENVNPDSIEQYFLQTTVKDVILNAFTFYLSGSASRENSTFDYWKTIDDQWQQYMSSMASNFSNDSWPELRHTFGILRQNWDAPGYWRKENLESTEEVYERMHIDLPLPEFRWEHGWQPKQRIDAELIRFSIQDAKDGDIIVRTHKCEDHVSRLIILFRELVPCEIEGLQMQKAMAYAYYNCYTGKLKIGGEMRSILVNQENKDICFRLAFDEERTILTRKLADVGLKWSETEKTLVSTIENVADSKRPVAPPPEEEPDVPELVFVEFNKARKSSNPLVKDIISVNTRSNKGRVTFNRIDSKEIEKKHVKYAMVGITRVGETMLMLCNNSKGVNIVTTSDKYCTLNSRELCEHLKRLLSVSDNLAYLHIEKVSEKIDSITYKVTKQ